MDFQRVVESGNKFLGENRDRLLVEKVPGLYI